MFKGVHTMFDSALKLDKADYDYVKLLKYKTFKNKINPSRLSFLENFFTECFMNII